MNNSAKDIKEFCLRCLAGREHSKQELLQKLTVKGYPRASAASVIAELAEEGWQNDLRYAENFARSRIAKGYGPLRIVLELRQNGVDLSTSPGAKVDLDEIVRITAGSWADLLEKTYHKKYGPDKRISVHEWAKRSRFLGQRGFSGAMISALVEHLNIKLINRNDYEKDDQR